MSDEKIQNEMNSFKIFESEEGQQQILDIIKNKPKITKIYFALLNNGTLRREMEAVVIPAMQRTPGVKLIWENPNKTWANPISSNRCKIVKRFLETDCDYLLMIDDDVVPFHNPCELIQADVDIVAQPALVRSSGQTVVWTAYIPHANGDGYSAVDLNSIDDMFDILEVAVVGTGCILIKRKVLEDPKVKPYFHPEFDEDGILKYGTDFAFCRRATNAGYKVYTTVHRRCEHFKSTGLNDVDGWDSVNYFDRSNVPYNIPWGEYSITQKDWEFIKGYLTEIQPKRILEFGSGLSSLLLSEEYEVISYETDPEWKTKIEGLTVPKNNLTIKLWDGINYPKELELEKFDFCFVDGPKQKLKGGTGRQASIAIASQITDHVIIHDAGRIEEETFQRAHLRGIFKLIRKSGNHLTRCHYWTRRSKPVTLEDVKKAMLENKKKG